MNPNKNGNADLKKTSTNVDILSTNQNFERNMLKFRIEKIAEKQDIHSRLGLPLETTSKNHQVFSDSKHSENLDELKYENLDSME